MARPSKDSRKEDRVLYFISFLLLLALVGILADKEVRRKLGQYAHNQNLAARKLNRQDLQKINWEMQRAAKLQEIQAQQVQLENALARESSEGQIEFASTLEERAAATNGEGIQPIDLVPEDKASVAYQETKFRREYYDRSRLPGERINQNIEMRQFTLSYDKMANKAFIQQFVENARQDGFAVEVDDLGRVTKVQRLRPEQGMLARNPQSVGSR